jgi:hypothetical protein
MLRGTLATTAVLALALLPAGPALAHEGGDLPTAERGAQVQQSGESKNMSFVANVQYTSGGEDQVGSDIEFLKAGRKEYALAGTLREGMQIIDITNPREPVKVATYDCDISQGDIQVWKNGTRILASYTADGTFGTEGAASRCAKDLGLDSAAAGTVIVDLTVPTRPATVSFLPVPRGSHNMTIHPSGDYLYNSNSDLITSTEPTITIYDISDPTEPRKVGDFPIGCEGVSLGCESHDVTFNASGTRAYSAALSQTVVLDTSNPAQPRIISKIVDPAVNVVHQSDPVTLTRPDGTKREVLVVTDERAGAAGSVECPGGGLHLYDITGAKEQDPQKIGTWFIDTIQPQAGTTCTSHVLRIYPRQRMMTIAWYGQGVRVLDISGLATHVGSETDVAFGNGVGMREVGHYVFSDSDTWSFKTNRINRDGSFFGYGNDLVRGLDVYRFDGAGLRVPALAPDDLGAAPKTSSTTHLTSLAIVGPAIVISAFLRRRRSAFSTHPVQTAP